MREDVKLILISVVRNNVRVVVILDDSSNVLEKENIHVILKFCEIGNRNDCVMKVEVCQGHQNKQKAI